MGLLTAEELDGVCVKAIEQGLAERHKALFFGFADEVIAQIESERGPPQDDLRMEASRLNNYEEPTASGYLLSTWLRNCERASRPNAAKFFAEWVARLEAKRRMAVPRADLDIADEPLIVELLKQMSGFIEALSCRANDLMISKRLHERLHRIQISVLPMLRGLLAMSDEQARIWRPLALQQARIIESESANMHMELARLAPDDSLAVLATSIISELGDKARILNTSLQATDHDARTQALYQLRETIKDGMSDFAGRIDANVQALNLQFLINNLNNLSDRTANAGFKDKSAAAARSLTAIFQDLSSLGDQHRAWQRLDGQLWWIETVFDSIEQAEFFRTIFTSEWAKLAETMERLAGTPPAGWRQEIQQLQDEFVAICPIPVTLPLAEDSPTKFQDLVGAIRQVFHEVDQRLLASCDRLDAITTQLASL